MDGTLLFRRLQSRELYKKQGVELIVFSSTFPGGMIAQTWAFLNRCYFLSSTPREGVALFTSKYETASVHDICSELNLISDEENFAKAKEARDKILINAKEK